MRLLATARKRALRRPCSALRAKLCLVASAAPTELPEGWEERADPQIGTYYYNPLTYEARLKRSSLMDLSAPPDGHPKYATPWRDERFPDWVQYLEISSKRPYYHCRATNGVAWSPPSNAELDVFALERDNEAVALTRVPDNAPPAGLGRRMTAGVVDLGVSTLVGTTVGMLVLLDLENMEAMSLSVMFASWGSFIARDMVFEHGTRSLGKRLLKLEIVRSNGELPSRWNNAFRQLTIPVYAAAGLLMPWIFFFAATDFGAMVFSKGHRRIGDFCGRTRVIAELPDRTDRLDEKSRHDEAEDAKD